MFHVKLRKKISPLWELIFFLSFVLFETGIMELKWYERKAVSNNYFLLIMSNFVSGMLRRAVSASLKEISFSGL